MEKTLEELLALVKSIAPEIWAIYLRQVYVDGILRMVLVVLLLVVFLVALVLFVKGREFHRKGNVEYFSRHSLTQDYLEESGGIGPLLLCCMVCCLAVSVTILITTAGVFINPEYYAIQNILYTLK